MRLRDLDGYFVGEYSTKSFRRLETIEGAQGVMFQCPKCAAGLPIVEELIDGVVRRFTRGPHYVLCWFTNPRNAPRVPDEADPKPGRWEISGTSLDDLTFTGPSATSVLLTGGCGWHGFVKNGDAT